MSRWASVVWWVVFLTTSPVMLPIWLAAWTSNYLVQLHDGWMERLIGRLERASRE